MGTTPLHDAAGRGDEEQVLALLRAGADPTLRDDRGRTAAECVPVGNVTFDPEEVAGWRRLRAMLVAAAAQARGPRSRPPVGS